MKKEQRLKIQLRLTLYTIVFAFFLVNLMPAFSQQSPTFEQIQAIQQRHEDELLARAGVRGIGIGLEGRQYVFKVLVNYGEGRPQLPINLEGVPVRVTPVGDIVAQQIQMGNSTSNNQGCFAGTLGFKVSDNANPSQVGYVTNNHVAGAGGFLLCPNQAPIGTDQFFPGTLDSGCSPATFIGDLTRRVTITFRRNANNFVDAAYVKSPSSSTVSNQIGCGIGAPSTVTLPPSSLLNRIVQKCGRTSGFTQGQVVAVNVTITVNYGFCGTARFRNQIQVQPTAGFSSFSQSGDSGSGVVTDANEPAGLLFAGDGFNTFCNDMGEVLSRLNVSLASN